MDRMNYPGFENLLRTHRETFIDAYSPRQINNIYFDTLDLTAYESNLSGNSAKKKYRIRWYGSRDMDSPIADATLEIKIKRGALNRKICYPMPTFSYVNLLTPHSFLDLIKQAGLSPNHFEELACMQPVLVNSYQRKYHLSMDRRFRFTSDSGILFRLPVVPKDISTSQFQFLDKIIVELKYAQHDDNDAESIIQRFPLRAQSCSKFSTGIRLCRL